MDDNYIVTDSISKAVFIDGFTTAEFLLAYSFVDPTITIPSITINTAISTATAFLSYYVRSEARANDHEYIGGIMGGFLKYYLRENLLNFINKKETFTPILFGQGIVGSGNNLMYETLNNAKLDPIGESSSMIALESLDSVFTNSIKGQNIYTGAAEGAIAGIICSFNVFYVYTPLVEYTHIFADTVAKMTEVKAFFSIDEFI
ncbi:MAG: hypothetical protein AABY27_04955 [Pseudomonadota bacterium]